MEFGKQGDEPERYKILERSVADAHFDTIAGDEFVDNAVWMSGLNWMRELTKFLRSRAGKMQFNATDKELINEMDTLSKP
jgi:hypothetical protein